ncbi:MAG TPA: Spy/CpxP family protein refolding chaperone, partial [Pseudolabrys sp.]
AAPNRAETRAAQRQERALRKREDRSVRRLPASQRASRREEIRNAREQCAQQRQQATTPNVAAQPNAGQQQRAARRNGRPRVAAQAARQGRFASAFARSTAATTRLQRQAHRNRWSAREAWRHHARAPFIAWYGPVFWPYAYTDVFDYTFWPEGYDDGYWAYAYDDFVDGLFWGEEGPPAEYTSDYASAPASSGESAAPAPVRYAAVQELCKQPGNGVTAWPIADIEKKVGLKDDQKQLLADMSSAAKKAADVFKAACPAKNAFPLTPPGRLASMTARLQATAEAVDTVKPALDKFYNSLSDEQKERFNEIGPKAKPGAETTAQASADTTQSCKQPKPGLANLPIEKVEDAVNPTDAQADGLDKLQAATDKAVGILQAACPDQTPLTPPGRLDAMDARLKAMIDAANTVKPALDSFYASLSNEQKARFNHMGGELASTND